MNGVGSANYHEGVADPAVGFKQDLGAAVSGESGDNHEKHGQAVAQENLLSDSQFPRCDSSVQLAANSASVLSSMSRSFVDPLM